MTPGLLSAWGWCPPGLFVQINLRQDLSGKKKNTERNTQFDSDIVQLNCSPVYCQSDSIIYLGQEPPMLVTGSE